MENTRKLRNCTKVSGVKGTYILYLIATQQSQHSLQAQELLRTRELFCKQDVTRLEAIIPGLLAGLHGLSVSAES